MAVPMTINSPATSGAKSGADVKSKTNTGHEGPRDTTREIFETVVFVVVLVLMLKLFVAEAFVIPTGSMAPTLWGDQVRCTCRKCGYKFPINCAPDNEGKHPVEIKKYICENCGYNCTERDASNDLSSVHSGDRVLVSKYEYHLRDPRRFEIPVFRFPVEPYSDQKKADGESRNLQGMNYIKRLVGLGGETLAVFAGDLYVTRALNYDWVPLDKRPQNETDAWQFRYMYANDDRAMRFFMDGNFEIVRKSPDEIMAVRRIVFDLDHQPNGPEGVRKTRWHASPENGAGWEMEAAGFKHSGDEPAFMVYQHIDPWSEKGPYYIVDSIGYNLMRGEYGNPFISEPIAQDQRDDWVRNHWVSDLILDCTVEIPSPDSQVILELAKGRNRFQAVFHKGECKLVQIATGDGDRETRREMGSHPTRMTKSGKYGLRFANVDSRLTVWVDNKPIAFGADQADHAPPDPTRQFEPFEKNDLLQPARIGASGEVKYSKVSLWRDLEYNCGFPQKDTPRRKFEPTDKDIPACGFVQSYFVQPGHYLMFGDNSNSSADSRSWGLVPERLMLGRAVIVYFPFSRMGVIE
jgi:signal peptidase I